MIYRFHIFGGLQFSGVHEQITEWIKNTPSSSYDKLAGKSVINSKEFYSKVLILDEEDATAFGLRFAGYVYYDKYSQLT